MSSVLQLRVMASEMLCATRGLDSKTSDIYSDLSRLHSHSFYLIMTKVLRDSAPELINLTYEKGIPEDLYKQMVDEDPFFVVKVAKSMRIHLPEVELLVKDIRDSYHKVEMNTISNEDIDEIYEPIPNNLNTSVVHDESILNALSSLINIVCIKVKRLFS